MEDKKGTENTSNIVQPGYSPQPEEQTPQVKQSEQKISEKDSVKKKNKKLPDYSSQQGPMGENNKDAVSGIDYTVPS